MTGTFELICHHTYSGWDGLPVDLSDHGSHGQAYDTEFLADGAAPGSGAVRFPLPQSRIRVPSSPASRSLGGIMVEVTVRRARRLSRFPTLVAGHASFSFFLAEDQLGASFRGRSTQPLATSDGLNAESHGVVSPRWAMPQGDRWVTLGFLHDGIDTMELYADGQLIARRTDLLASVPPVGPIGISIGGEPDQNDRSFLGGDIDEVKIWRPNPRAMDVEFFSRPMDEAVAGCWARFFRSLGAALVRHPDCARRLDAALAAMLDGTRRDIMAKGPETRDRYVKACERYLRLWTADRLDSPEMAKLVADWCAWLRLVGFSFEDDPGVAELLQSDCLRRVLAECEPPDCDPRFAALLRFAARGCARSAETAG